MTVRRGAAARRLRHLARAAASQQLAWSGLSLTDEAGGGLDEASVEGLRHAVDAAVAAEDYRQAAELQQTLTTLAGAPVTLSDCLEPTTADERAAFFWENGFLCIPQAFAGAALQRQQQAWLAAQAPHRAAWLEATQQGEEVKRSQGQRADLFFDIPTDPRWWSEELWRTRRPGTAGRQLFFELDPAFVDIIDAAPLLEVLERVVGPDVECTGVQARSVPPAPHAGQAYTR